MDSLAPTPSSPSPAEYDMRRHTPVGERVGVREVGDDPGQEGDIIPEPHSVAIVRTLGNQLPA